MRQMTDLLKGQVQDAAGRLDKRSLQDIAIEAYDAILIEPEAMQPLAGPPIASRGVAEGNFDAIQLLAVGAQCLFNVIHRPDWTIGGSFNVELLVRATSVVGSINVTITHYGYKAEAGAPVGPHTSSETQPVAAILDLVVLKYWDVFTTDGDEAVNGFLVTNNGSIDVFILGATVRHRANRV